MASPQALGVIDDFVSGQPSEHRLPQQAHQRMAAVPARTDIGKHITSHCAETEGVVELAVGKQTSVESYPRAMELKLHAAVKIEP